MMALGAALYYLVGFATGVAFVLAALRGLTEQTDQAKTQAPARQKFYAALNKAIYESSLTTDRPV